jgi:hypothetical protein
LNDAPRETLLPSTAPDAAVRATKAGRTRAAAGLVLLGCLAILALAAWLRPDPHGYGTHAQLGTGPCGALVMTGYPCPTCGMTTAFAHTVRGQWLRALWVQPAGFVLALGTLGLAGVAGWTAFCGRWPRPNVRFVTPYRLFLGLLVMLLAAWAFKIVAGLADGTLPYR